MSRKHRASSQATTEVEAPLSRRENAKYTVIWIACALAALAGLFALTSSPSANAAPVQTGIIKPVPPPEGSGGDFSGCGSSIPFTAAKGGITPDRKCGSDGITEKEATTYKLFPRCGGAAGLGSLRGGAWYGAAVAGTGCVWGHVWS